MNEYLNDVNVVLNENMINNNVDLSLIFNNIYLLLQVLLIIIFVVFLYNYLRNTFKFK